MKFDIEAADLREAAAQSIASNLHQIAGHILLDARDGTVSVSSTDLETAITRHLQAEVSADGRATCDQKLLRSALAGLSGPVSVELKDGFVLVRQDRRRFRLPSLNPDDFPAMDDREIHSLPSDGVADAIDLVSYASATKDSRYWFNGVYLWRRIVAANGYAMAVAAGEFDLPGLIVPIKAVPKIVQALREPGAGLGLIKNQDAPVAIIVVSDSSRVSARLIDAKYPDVMALIPNDYPEPVKFSATEALAAINRLMPFAEGGGRFACDLLAAELAG